MQQEQFEYVGFWTRFGATLVDTILILLITSPLVTAIYGTDYWISGGMVMGWMDFLISWVFPFVAVILFWHLKQATPGKMAMRARVVSAKTGQAPSLGQCIGRYFAYILSTLPLGLGFIWVAIDDRKQGWHDKLAGTLVVRVPSRYAADTQAPTT